VKRFSAWGYLAFTVWGLGAGMLMRGWRLGGLVAVELAFGLLWSREGLGMLRRWRFWVFIGTAVVLGPWLARRAGMGGVSMGAAGIPSWWPGLSLGLEMAARALALMLAFSLGMSALSLSDMLTIFDQLHLRGLGFALGVAMNLLATLQEMARTTFETIKLRGGLRRPLAALRLFLVTLVSNTLRYGEQIVNAASVRAFDPAGGRRRVLRPRRADLLLTAALAACAAGCWIL
jgi:energy-coupling factor transporter transmembrane protein EcfT